MFKVEMMRFFGTPTRVELGVEEEEAWIGEEGVWTRDVVEIDDIVIEVVFDEDRGSSNKIR